MQAPMPQDELHFELLRELTKDPAASQRRLADRLGVSVGKLNYCLRALIDKGWVKANNFRRSDNKLAYVYLLTPTGVSAKIRLTRSFIERKELEFETLSTEIRALKLELPVDRVQSHSAESTDAGDKGPAPAALRPHGYPREP